MEWFLSQCDCIYKPYQMYYVDNQFKGSCKPTGKNLSACTPIVNVARKTKCVTVRIVITIFLLILIMAIIYRISALNLSYHYFSYQRRIPLNTRFDDSTLIGNLNQSSIPSSHPISKLEQPDDSDVIQDTHPNLGKPSSKSFVPFN